MKFLLFTLVKDIEISCIIKWKISLSSIFNKKNLKIPKGGNQNLYIEDEQTINTMAKRKSTKGQTTINKTYI